MSVEGEHMKLPGEGSRADPHLVMEEEAFGFTVCLKGQGKFSLPAMFPAWANALEKRVHKASVPGCPHPAHP